MDRAPLNFAFSSCPNDTFAFHAIVHGLVPGPAVVPHMDDVEALNARAERGDAEVTKISIAAYARICDRYALLRAGGAAGFGVGPIVVAKSAREVGGRVAIPGERTTAALLLRLLGRFETVPMRFDRIEHAVLRGDVDCGVLIHEGRFTYQAKGLALLEDLGDVWENANELPAPACGHRDSARPGRRRMARVLTALFAQAWNMPSRIPTPAGSMSANTRRRWMRPSPRSTSSFTSTITPLALDERAVHALLDWQQEQRPNSAALSLPVFA